ncbi:DUF2953 domain-containing protein [Terribacillus sp. DMT04]|uniref:DUF2953 domain-containing protein n=1 Tax=Terribacillus sp. DMT04 TaxID=2850441 RepID=UPI001C2B796C|nr:DUF2953 domain-containing protein [Terribacillus sp. DMT04]QXE00707.1 DUF2953 domain-containing protein [Terribacillus sp. DMT04]
MWMTIIIGAIIVLVLLIITLSANVMLHIYYEEKRWRMKVSIVGIVVYKKRFSQQKPIQSAAAEELKESLDTMTEDLRKLWHAFPYLLHITRTAELHQLRWHTTVGTADAASAAALAGVVWTFKGIVQQLISLHIKVNKPIDIQVNPVFHTAVFHSNFQCIVSFRTGKAIQAIISNVRR